MDINSPVANGIPDNFDTLSPEQLKEYRITYGHYVAPTTVLRLLEPRAYFSGLIWELEELLRDRHRRLKHGYRYHSNNNAYYGNNSNMVSEQMRLSEKDYSEEEKLEESLQLPLIKELFIQQQQGSISSPVSELQETDTMQTFINFNCQKNNKSGHTSTTGGGVSCDEVTKPEEEQHIVNVTYPGKAIEGIPVSGTKTEYTVSLSQDTAVNVEQCELTEQQNINNNSDDASLVSLVLLKTDDINGSSTTSNFSENSTKPDIPYLIQEIYQTPVLHFSTPTYSMLEHSM